MRRTAIGLAVTLLVLMTWSPVTAADIRLTYRSSTLWSRVTGIVPRDTLLYCTVVNGLLILNVADPANPQYVAKLYLSDGEPTDIRLQGDRAYITGADHKLYVVDVADPFALKLLGEYRTRGNALGLDVVDTLAYVAYGGWTDWLAVDDWVSGVSILDVSRPEAITSVVEIPYADPIGATFQVTVNGGYAYALAAGLWIIDVSNPLSPVSFPDFWHRDYRSRSLAFTPSDTIVLLAEPGEISPTWLSSLTAVSVARADSPVVLSRLILDGRADRVTCRDSLAVVANGRRGAVLFNIADPAHPDSLSRYGQWEVYYASAVAIRDTFLFVGDAGPQSDVESASLTPHASPAAVSATKLATPSVDLHVVNIADPAHPAKIGGYSFPPSVTNVVPGGRYAYALYDGNVGPDDTGADLTVVDLVNPDSPLVRGSYRTAGTAVNGTLVDTLMYLAVGWLEIVNVADPDNPTLVSSLSTGGSCNDIQVRGNYAYAACGRSGVYVIDISDPTQPTVISTRRTRHMAFGIALNGDYAYVADLDAVLSVVNISDPFHPTLEPADYTSANWSASEARFENGYLYLGGFGGIAIFDTRSDPAAPPPPIQALSYPLTQGIFVRNGLLFVANERDSLYVVDVSDPYAPRKAAAVSTPGGTEGVAADDRYLYAADEHSLIIYDITGSTDASDPEPASVPESFTLHQNYPNPFNPSTTITYDLSRRSDVRLSIYNVLGQEVATLVDGAQPAGRHEVRWEAPDRASGVYFYQLSIDSRAESRKMILLK